MNIIVAVDQNWAIGTNGGLLMDLTEDMKFFREKTNGSAVIMGRKTLETFPNKKPLKNRVNIVISKSSDLGSEGIIKVSSIQEALNEAKKYDNVFVIGGGTIYNQMLKYCDTAYVTKIQSKFLNADTFIDNIDNMPEWNIVEKSSLKEYNGIKFSFVTYKRA